MIRLCFCLLLALVPLGAAAQSYPALHDVTGVASDDVLNVRAGPGASHEIVGELAHDAAAVEVVAVNDAGTWGLVNAGERSGWASLAYLARRPGNWTDSPTTITGCFGTEPFWSVRDLNGTLQLNNLGEELFSAPADPLTGSAATGMLATAAADGTGFVTLAIRQEMCSDGMSDMDFGLSATVVSRLDGWGTQLWTGCCTVSP